MSSAVTDPAVLAMLKEAAYYIRASQIIFWYVPIHCLRQDQILTPLATAAHSVDAVCLWDWLVSLPREWRLIWKSQWSVIKVLYLLCRYWVLLVVPYVLWVFTQDHSLEACMKLYKSPVALAMWNQLWAEGVLLVRTFAFLGNKKVILIPLLVCLSGVVAYQLYVDNTQMTLLPFLDPAGGPCFPTVKYVGSPHIMLFFVFPLLFDTLVTCLTLWRAWTLRRQSGSSGSPLLKTFVSEGLWYFLLISAANLCNAIFYWQPKAVMSALLIPLSIMFPDVLACRMILGLRERGVRHNGQSTSAYNSRTARSGTKLSATNQPGKSAGATAVASNGGVVTKMGFNHELTTFNGNGVNTIAGDVKTIPYDMEDGPLDNGRSQGIRVDIESHRYYEERSDAESGDDKKGRSFMP
ncbi:hypothetical protein FRB90_005968 [Tulasnella sp. 427]|nr:hypothetical protein FRB90_005968 [Tulasnella sp. 427]